MTPLRQRMMQDLQLRGYSDRTVEAYVRAVAQLAKFYHASPDQLTEEQVRHQELVYAALLREAAASVQTLAEDRTWVGGTPGILAVLHTWTRTMEYHPHAHLLVTAGGLASDGSAWVKPTHPRFLMPGYALAPIFRAKMRTALSRAELAQDVDPIVWAKAWVVHVQHIGRGAQAIRYLLRYVYHVALTNHRLEKFEHGRVTFRYTHARTHETRRLTLPVDTFITRFLQHVLPRGFTKIRYYGLLSPTSRADLERARHVLELHAVASSAPASGTATVAASVAGTIIVVEPVALPATRCCPVCQRGALRLVARMLRCRAPPA